MGDVDNEILELSCSQCEKNRQGTYQELFGDLPSLRLLPKLECTCGGDIRLGFTGKFKENKGAAR